MYEIIGQLRCPKCKEHVQLHDKIILDEMNTILHVKCFFTLGHPYQIKDQGTFQKMIMKYPFFNEYSK